MRTQSHRAAIFGLFFLGMLTSNALADFSDSFEGILNTTFWASVAQSGYVVCPSSTRAHSGASSVELVTTDSGQTKNVRIYHDFGTPTYGTVSFWVFDTSADLVSGNSITFLVTRTSTLVADIWTPDYGSKDSTYCWGTSAANGPSAIDRTQAWHQFSISCLPDSLALTIDNQLIYSALGDYQFDRVDMDLSGVSSRPALSMQFDDFSFVASVPEPGVFGLLFGAIGVGIVFRKRK